MIKVTEHQFRTPVREAPPPTPPPQKYGGRFDRVVFRKPAFAIGEEIVLDAFVTVTRTADLDPFFTSVVRTIVRGRKVDEDVRRHGPHTGVIPFAEATQSYRAGITPGRQIAGGLSGTIELWVGGSPMTKVATASINAPVAPAVVDRVPVTRPDEVRPGIGLGLLVLGGLVLFALAKKEE